MALGKDANYVFSGSQWTPAVKYRPSFYLGPADYVAAYRKKFRTQNYPDYHVADSTAAALALQKAIEAAGSLQPDRVRDALAALDVTTFYGRIKFDSRGINAFKPMVVEQIQQGQRQTVWPPELANASVLYPTPSWTVRSGVPPLETQPKAPDLPTTGRPVGS
jgi:branched-chain amino acid transport system substrate-binding protein